MKPIHTHQKNSKAVASNWKNTELVQCGCGGTYHDCTKGRKRHFNSDKHKYWIEHGELKPKKNESIHCECGGQYTIENRNRHFKSIRHLKYLASQE